MNLRYITIFLAILVLTACDGEKKRPAFYDNGVDMEEEAFASDTVVNTEYVQTADVNIISIPFTEKNGVKYVDVSVNGFGFEMIFDTGCASTLISVAEANYLYKKGYLTTDDIVGFTQSLIADGSIVANMVVNLKEVVIGGKIRCTDVTATVSSNNNAPLLLGNEVLDRVAAYAVDNENQTINFKLK